MQTAIQWGKEAKRKSHATTQRKSGTKGDVQIDPNASKILMLARMPASRSE